MSLNKSKGRGVGKKHKNKKKRGPPNKLTTHHVRPGKIPDHLKITQSITDNLAQILRDGTHVISKLVRFSFLLLIGILTKAVFVGAEMVRDHLRLLIALAVLKYSENLLSLLGLIDVRSWYVLMAAGLVTVIWELLGFTQKYTGVPIRDRLLLILRKLIVL